MTNEKLDPSWIEGVNLDLGFDYGWRRVPQELSDQIYEKKGFKPEYMLKYTKSEHQETKILKVALEYSHLALFTADPRSFGVRSLFGERDSGVRIDFVPGIRADDGLDSYDALIFKRHKRLKEKDFKVALMNIISSANIVLKWLNMQEIPPFERTI